MHITIILVVGNDHNKNILNSVPNTNVVHDVCSSKHIATKFQKVQVNINQYKSKEYQNHCDSTKK